MKYLSTLACLALLAGCPPKGTGGKDMGGGGGICPDNPAQCGGKCCGNQCIDTMLDVKNCGDCQRQCDPGQVCNGGNCGCLPSGAPCGTGQMCCPSVGCKFTDNDANNCGGCGKACGAGGACSAGKCTCGGSTCTSTQVCCNGSCADTCANPDMAGPAAGACTCTSMCPLSKICLATDCCFEDVFLMLCTPPTTMTCTPYTYP